MARRALGLIKDYFDVVSFRAMAERRINARGQETVVSEAVVKVLVDGEPLMSVAEGTGPVNALDQALRQDLGRSPAYLAALRLVDYKVQCGRASCGARGCR